jgi:2-polyprenyl-3-methyl-5-hydroxy-6-metoxy-1,4-benzoquinol methylase
VLTTSLPPVDIERLTLALTAFAQLRAPGEDTFLDAKESPLVRAERVRSYRAIRPGLDGAKRVLDWGCRHGASARLVRADLGDAVELHGADFSDPAQYREFHAASALQYRQITHPWRLDYDEGFFDAVIGAGVLEHVANVGESLTELWRVLRVDGALLLTHLPNARSWSEWLSRRTAPELAHARRFRPQRLSEQLLDHGFAVEQWGYHHFPPTTLPARGGDVAVLRNALHWSQPLRVLERVWPLRTFSAAIWVIARKKWGF